MSISDDKRKVLQIVEQLRAKWPEKITDKFVGTKTRALGKIQQIQKSSKESGPKWIHNKTKYVFDSDKYPDLLDKYSFIRNLPEKPRNLAEALLWKDGKWNAYKQFIKDHSPVQNPDASDRDNIVFYAFARHLRSNKETPIFDQHSARAMWAIASDTWALNYDPFRRFLFEGSGKKEHWKSNPGGSLAYACWDSFCTEIANAPQLDLEKLDDLLMPLGQALKHFSIFECRGSQYAHFCSYFNMDKRKKVRAPNRTKATIQ